MVATTRPRSGAASFAIAALVATCAAAAGLLVGLLEPSTGWRPWLWLPVRFPPGADVAVIALAAALVAWPVRRRSESAAYLLLAAACLAGGLAAHEVAGAAVADPARAGNRVFTALLVAYAGLFWASALVLTAWAAAPGRSLGRWVAPFGMVLVVATVLGSTARAWGYLGAASVAQAALPSGRIDLSVAWRSGLAVGAILALGSAGALRADGRAHLAAGRPARALPVRPAGTAFWLTAVAALAAWMVALALPAGAVRGGIAPLLWLLIGCVAVRWSSFAAWAALAASCSLSAARSIEPAARSGALTLGTVAAPPDWLALLAGWLSLAVAAWAGWQSLAAVGPRSWADRAAIAVLVAIGVAPAVVIALGPTGDLAVDGTWLSWLVLAPVAAGAWMLLWGRLVSAAAEAEAVSADGLVPSRYLAVLGTELLTREAGVRAASAEAERARIASDLHAEVLPSLAQIAAESAAGAPHALVAERLRSVEADVRALLAEQRNAVLEELGIVEALEWLVGRAEEQTTIDIELEVDPRSSDDRPPRPVERAAFRVAQLAVGNTIRHAEASRLRLEVLVRPDCLRVAVVDDGRGIGAAQDMGGAHGRGYGLADMRAQAAQVLGRLVVEGRREGGTVVTFEWTAP